MPSPVGHALAGIAVAWGADLLPGIRTWRTASATASWYARAGNGLTLSCAALAVAPDLDLLFTGFHRSVTHSFISILVVAGVCALAAARARLPVARIVCMCAGAWATHMLLDWLAADPSSPRGIQAFWPFDERRFISGWDIFPETERRQIFSAPAIRENLVALVSELALMGPLVLGLWLVRVKALAGFSPELARRHHPAE
jgi:membrane-bound metal-dependent hydrolase YbcI (DUF457 family)